MSHQAVTWAYAQDVKPAGAKFVLVTLANYADSNGHCYSKRSPTLHAVGQLSRSLGSSAP